MRYHGFAIRDYLILANITINRESSVLEIGVGTGSMADLIIRKIGKIKKYCGVDISTATIDWLNRQHRDITFVKFYVLDVCKDESLGEKFDIIFSADTLEHVKDARRFFKFIARHLSSDGQGLITFPNESENRHHGITWFNSRVELFNIIESCSLNISSVWEVNETSYHRIIRKYLYDLPKSIMKSIMSRQAEMSPQSFECTDAFAINQSGKLKRNLFALYGRMVTTFTACFPLYRLIELQDDITNKRLLLKLVLK